MAHFVVSAGTDAERLHAGTKEVKNKHAFHDRTNSRDVRVRCAMWAIVATAGLTVSPGEIQRVIRPW